MKNFNKTIKNLYKNNKVLIIALFSLLGIAYVNNRRIQTAKDIELIESWSAFVPRELDEEFDNKEH